MNLNINKTGWPGRAALTLLIAGMCLTGTYAATEYGIGEGYDPESPGNPGSTTGESSDSEIQYNISTIAKPAGAGSVYPNSTKIVPGRDVRVYTYNNTGYEFKCWTLNGDTVSTQSSFYYTMPEHDVTLVANYVYNPASPGNPSPEEQKVSHPVTVKASPASAASMSPSGSFSMEENTTRYVYAYPEDGWHLTGWTVNGETLESVSSPIEITMGEKALDIVASFEYNPTNPGNPGANDYNESLGQVIIDDFTPGNLYSALSRLVGNNNFGNVNTLIVKGEMDTNDVGTLGYLSNAAVIDLSRTGGLSTLPGYAFYGMNVSDIELPSTVGSIGDYTFYNCQNLSSLTIFAQEPPACTSRTFSGFDNKDNLTVYVPASAIELYTNADYWKDFNILPITNDAHLLQVTLPAEAEDGRYKNNSIELVNISTGVRLKYVISDRLLYTFNGMRKDEQYIVFMYAQNGMEIGRIEDIIIPDKDMEVSFDEIRQLHTLTASVKTPDGNDVTSNSTVEWLQPKDDGSVNYLRKAASVSDIPEGQTLICRVTLGQDLGSSFSAPSDTEITAGSDNICEITLKPFRNVTLSGTVVDGDGAALSDAAVSATQTLNGKYPKTYTAKTDRKGLWSLNVLDAPETRLTFAASECVNVNDTIGAFEATVSELDLGKRTLKSIVGARISYGFTHHAAGVEEVENYYADYQNVAVSVYNVTQDRAHNDVSLQYPILAVLDENINTGDELRLTATSKTGAFNPIVETVTVGDNQRAEVTFDIVGKGGIAASFEMTENTAVIAMLYGSNGELLKKSNYAEAQAKFTELEDGDYTLVSMGQSDLMSSILRLSNYDEIGLTEGKDYVKNAVTVESGKLAEVKNPEIPIFDESLFYYTNSSTNFSSNKSSITTGNYLTLRAAIDFKGVYKNDISNVALVIDLPENCNFVDESVIQGPNLLPYTFDNNRLTIQLGDNYQSQVRFCVVPSKGGILNISSSISFVYKDKLIIQPIGASSTQITDLVLIVPTSICTTDFIARGECPAFSKVIIKNGDNIVGAGSSNGKGEYIVKCQLPDPIPYLNYSLNAEITTENKSLLTTAYTPIAFNPNDIHVSKVQMISPSNITFDFEKPSEPSFYTFVPSNNVFTFITEFNQDSSNKVSEANLIVKTLLNNYYSIPAKFNKVNSSWIASSSFGDNNSSDVPVNVLVDFVTIPEDSIDITRAENQQLDELVYCSELISESIGKLTTEPIFIKDEEDQLSFSIRSLEYDNDLTVDIKVLEYQQERQKLSREQYTFCKIENGYYCYLEKMTSDGIVVSIIDTGEEYALEITISGVYEDNSISKAPKFNSKAIQAALQTLKTTFKKGFKESFDNRSLFGMVGGTLLDLIGISKYAQVPVFSIWCDMLNDYINAYLRWREIIVKSLYAKCDNGEYKLTSDQRELYQEIWDKIDEDANKFHADYFDYLDLYKKRLLCSLGYDLTIGLATKGVGKAFEGLSTTKKFMTNSKNAKYWKYIIPMANSNTAKRTALGNSLSFCAESWFTALTNSVETIVNPEFTDFTSVGDKFNTWGPSTNSEIINRYNTLNSQIKADYSNCKKKDKEKEKVNKPKQDFPVGDTKVSIDPSGYVYEAVPANRVQGVEATIYYKETKEDMYGDPYEEVVLWNAEEYAQENPLFTDEYGMYQWDVPQGLWQVKFEKDGYATAYSEWLPVPPPQLEVNIGITQNKQPEVTEARAYEEGVEVQFDKFMDLSTLTTDNIYVTANNEKLNGSISLIDSSLADEYADEEDADATRFASRIRFVPEQPLSVTTGEIRLTVSRNVLSYAGIPMAETFSQTLDVEKEVQTIAAEDVKVLYGGEKEITIFALPYEAAVGRTLRISTSSDLITSIDKTEAVIDEEGKATVIVKGELPGRAQLSFSIDDVTATGDCAIDVVTEIINAEAPKASRASGTMVYRGSKVELTTDSKDGVIYFTTDGSCPCDEDGTRRKYTVPIVINEDTHILAMTTVGTGDGDTSEVVEFNYSIKHTDIDFALENGWTWISHNMENPLPVATITADENVQRVLSQTQEVVRDPQLGIVGQLSELDATASYKVETASETTLSRLSDVAWNPAAAINLNNGWNWIGYPVAQTMTVDEALVPTEAESLDMIIGQNGFAQFDGENWLGTLETMSPGLGYLYQSQSEKQLKYNTTIVSKAAARSKSGITNGSEYVVDIHKYPSIMPLIATLTSQEGAELDNADYQVYAFCESECRGIGKLVNDMVMMSIYGERNDNITFLVTDAAGEKTFTCNEKMQFKEDVVGNIFEPYHLAINTMSGVEMISYDGNVRLSTEGDVMFVKGVNPDNVSLVEMFDIDGHRILRTTSITESGIRISGLAKGVYVVVVKADGEYSYHKIALK